MSPAPDFPPHLERKQIVGMERFDDPADFA